VTLDQALAFGILGAALLLLAWGRLRYDLVALLALLAGIAAGIVPAAKAFTGFGDDIVVIVGSALVVSAAVARSGAVEAAMRPLLPRLTTLQAQVTALAAAVLVASMLSKNIGALAIFIPVAVALSRRTGTPVSAMLMPMSFASLLGGLVTLVGTSPNIIVSRVREEATGQPFAMFDYAPVGLGVALAGLAFLAVGWRLLPRDRRGAASLAEAFRLEDYTTEAIVPEGSAAIGRTVTALEAMAEVQLHLATLIRGRLRRDPPPPDLALRAGDILILEGEPEELERVVARAGLTLDAEKYSPDAPAEALEVVEGAVTAESPLVGVSPAGARLRERFGVGLLAVSRCGRRLRERLSDTGLEAGDVVILKGDSGTMPHALGALRILPLSARGVPLGRSRRGLVPVLILGATVLALAFRLVPVPVAFFAAAVLVLLARGLTMREAYEAMEWPVLVLLGALIPLSEAVRTTGGAELLAGWISPVLGGLPNVATLGLVMALAMAVTPFLNNAATVLALGPVAAGLAERLGVGPDAFLMAVAIGAACDFLTPIGHQCNTLVLGPGGYRFGDYPRLGLPLSLIVLAVGAPLLAVVWPVLPR
jgi:di/tricarboxylate transporter